MKKIFGNKIVLKKILITLLVFTVYRFGCSLTVPGIDTSLIGLDYFSPFALMNMLGGGSLAKFSIFALGISPYITAGIVIQLLASTELIPSLHECTLNGDKGRQTIERITRVLSFVLAIANAIALVYGFNNQYGIMESTTTANYVFVTTMLVSGSMIVIWLGDCISLHGVGNGITMLIFAGIVSELPSVFYSNFYNLILEAVGTDLFVQGIIHFVIFVLIYLVLILGTVWIEGAERRIPTQASGMVNRVGSNMSYLPIKLNPSGVMPIICAQTLLTTPLIYISFLNYDLYETLSSVMSLNTWSGLGIYGVLILLFGFIYADIVFDPETISNDMKKNGTYILGVRMGEETYQYIHKALNKTIVYGVIGIVVIGVLPYLLAMLATVMDTSCLGGNGIVICVGTALELVNNLATIQYENKYSKLGFLGKGK